MSSSVTVVLALAMVGEAESTKWPRNGLMVDGGSVDDDYEPNVGQSS